MREVRDWIWAARADISEVGPDAHLAEKNVAVVNEVLEDTVARAPAAFDIPAIIFHAHLHGVARRATVCAIDFLADLGDAGTSTGIGFTGVEFDWILPSQFLKVLADNP